MDIRGRLRVYWDRLARAKPELHESSHLIRSHGNHTENDVNLKLPPGRPGPTPIEISSLGVLSRRKQRHKTSLYERISSLCFDSRRLETSQATQMPEQGSIHDDPPMRQINREVGVKQKTSKSCQGIRSTLPETV